MALTRITKGVIKPNENYDTHNINSTGIVTAIGLDVNGNGDISGNLSVGGVLTYEDVTSIDSVGIITAQSDIHVGGGVSAVGVGTFGGLDINGDLDVDGHTNLDNVSIAGVTTASDNIIIPDDKKLILGTQTGRQLHLYHNMVGSSNHVIESTSSSNHLILKAAVINPRADYFSFRNKAHNQDVLIIDADNSTKLFFNGNAKLTTEDTGVNITGIVTATSADINGDLDVDGHTNLDNVSIAGVVTATEYKGGGSTGIKVTSQGKVLIGTSNQGSTSADELTIENTGPMGISLRTNTTGESNVYFADGTSGTDRYAGYITYQHQYDRFRFGVNGGQLAVQINDDKSLNLFAGLSVSGIVTATGGDINGDLDVSGTVSATTFSGGLPITSGADNRVITASSASAIQGEANLTFNGTSLGINDSSGNARLIVSGNSDNGDADCQIRIYDTDTTAGSRIPSLSFWGSVEQGRIRGTDLSGMRFYTHDGNSLTEKFNIGSDGKVGINQGSPTGMLQVDAASYPETTEYLAVFKAGVGNGNRFKNRYIKIRNNYTGSVHGGVPIVWESNADNSNNKSYGAVVTEGNGDIRFLNAGATSEKAIGTDLLSTISEKLRITSDGNVVIGHNAANAKLHIASGSSSAVGDATNPALQIGNTSNYRFAIHTTNEQAIIANKSGDDGIAFHTKTAGNGGTFGEAIVIDIGGNLHIKGTDHATRYYRDDGNRYGSIFYNGSNFVLRQPSGDNFMIEKFDGTVLCKFYTDGSLSVGHDTPERRLHVKSGANNNDGAFRIESAASNIMDMGTDSSCHFLNCVNNDPFRIKFAGNEAIRVTQETSGNWTTSLQFYMETNNGQGASPYIKGVAGTESGGIDAHNAGGFEFHTRTGGAGTDVNAMKIDHNGRVSIGAHNIQNPTAALHIIADTQGTNTALQVGQDSGSRYFRVNELQGQSNFSDVTMSFLDNSLRNILILKNEYAAAANYGTAIQFLGYGGAQTGKIAVKNRDVNSASNSIMEIDASYVLKPDVPSFHAYNVSGTQSTNITFNNTWHNIGNHFNASTGTFTAPVSGRYLFAFAFLHSNSPTSYARVTFRINGSHNTRYGDTLCDDTGLYINTSMSMVFNLSVNDTVNLRCEGNNIYGQPNSQYGAFSGYLLG